MKENELNNHPDSDARTTKKYKEKSVCNMSDISMKKFLFYITFPYLNEYFRLNFIYTQFFFSFYCYTRVFYFGEHSSVVANSLAHC